MTNINLDAAAHALAALSGEDKEDIYDYMAKALRVFKVLGGPGLRGSDHSKANALEDMYLAIEDAAGAIRKAARAARARADEGPGTEYVPLID